MAATIAAPPKPTTAAEATTTDCLEMAIDIAFFALRDEGPSKADFADLPDDAWVDWEAQFRCARRVILASGLDVDVDAAAEAAVAHHNELDSELIYHEAQGETHKPEARAAHAAFHRPNPYQGPAISPTVLGSRPTGRAPRLSTNSRSRGSRRSTRAGPSSDDPPDEADSDDGLVECAAEGCAERFPPRGAKRFHSAKCAARDRQRRHRHGDPAAKLSAADIRYREFARITEPHSQTFRYTGGAHARLVSQEAARAAELRALLERVDHADEYMALRTRVCRCNGSHIDAVDDDGELGCFKCGRSREGAID